MAAKRYYFEVVDMKKSKSRSRENGVDMGLLPMPIAVYWSGPLQVGKKVKMGEKVQNRKKVII